MNSTQQPLASCPNQSLLWCLRFVVFLQCVGVAGRYLFAEFESDSDIYGLLFFDWLWPESLAQRIDDTGSWICFIAGIGLLFPICSSAESFARAFIRRTQLCAAALIAFWMFALAATHMIRGGIYSELSLGEHAVRYAAPLALIVFLSNHGQFQKGTNRISFFREGVFGIGIVLLTLAVSATFMVHGYKALQHHGQFADLILLSDANWTGLGLEQSLVEQILWGIGVIDAVAAILLWTRLMPIAAIYMVIWGVLTAASRMTAMGTNAWPDTLIRSANWGCPLVLFLSYMLIKSRPSTPDPAKK